MKPAYIYLSPYNLSISWFVHCHPHLLFLIYSTFGITYSNIAFFVFPHLPFHSNSNLVLEITESEYNGLIEEIIVGSNIGHPAFAGHGVGQL